MRRTTDDDDDDDVEATGRNAQARGGPVAAIGPKSNNDALTIYLYFSSRVACASGFANGQSNIESVVPSESCTVQYWYRYDAVCNRKIVVRCRREDRGSHVTL